jgi:hypothetical protein
LVDADGLAGVEALARRFPDKALKARRLFWHSAHFREICQDYSTVEAWLARCLSTHHGVDPRTRDYVEMRSELEVELLMLLADAAPECDDQRRP